MRLLNIDMFLRILFLLLISGASVLAQNIDSVSFPKLLFSPYENFHFIAINRLLAKPAMDGFTFDQYEYVVPFGTGVCKEIVKKKNYLLSLDGSINVQFIFRNENSKILKGLRKTHFNTDFFLRLHNVFRLSATQKLRATAFHRSTHLGDDYVVLNPFSSNRYWSTDETNYEALQLDYSFEKKSVLLYGGGRFVFRLDTPRKRIEFHNGVVFKEFLKGSTGSKLIAGYDLKLMQNNGFNPDLDLCLGYVLSEKSHIQLKYYSGHLPFSRLERKYKASWLGIGYYLNIQSF